MLFNPGILLLGLSPEEIIIDEVKKKCMCIHYIVGENLEMMEKKGERSVNTVDYKKIYVILKNHISKNLYCTEKCKVLYREKRSPFKKISVCMMYVH